MKQLSAGQSNEISGELRIAAIANMASSVLMPLLVKFNAAYPNINLSVEVTNDSVRLAERDADVALRQTNSPGETLIGTRLATIASAVYGSVDCCEHHRKCTRQAAPQLDPSFCVDDTSVPTAALKEGLGVGYLPCFIGDSEPTLVRFRQPKKQHDLGLWLLYHRDLRGTQRVLLFREHMQREIDKIGRLFEGVGSQAAEL